MCGANPHLAPHLKIMKTTTTYDDCEKDGDLPTDGLSEIRDDLIDLGYKCYYDEENDEHYWIKRKLTAWEEKELRKLSDKGIREL